MYLTHITVDGERWDQLATKYYGDPFAYEQIIAVNPHVPITVTLPGGLTLSIPIIAKADVTEDLPPWLR